MYQCSPQQPQAGKQPFITPGEISSFCEDSAQICAGQSSSTSQALFLTVPGRGSRGSVAVGMKVHKDGLLTLKITEASVKKAPDRHRAKVTASAASGHIWSPAGASSERFLGLKLHGSTTSLCLSLRGEK